MGRLAIGAVLTMTCSMAMAGMTTTITDTQPIIDFPLCRCGTPLPGVLDFALFDYSTQPKLCGLDRLDFTFTMEDGDTAPGNFDFNNLSLALDDIDTGIKLNGFAGGQENTLTFSLVRGTENWLSDQTIEKILDSLNDDGQLFASIVDSTPNDNEVNLYSALDTQLSLTGTICEDPNQVPEPATILVWGTAAAIGLVHWRRRRIQAIGR